MKIKRLLILVATISLLSGCGTIHTNNPVFDILYNVSSAMIEVSNEGKTCDQPTAIERKKCRALKEWVFEDID